jgi:hypothetical protein
MTKEEFETQVSEFVDRYNNTEGDFLDEWLVFEMLIHCRTSGCPRDGIDELAFVAVPLDGVWKVVCSQCNRPVEDIDPQVSDDPDYRVAARYPDGSSWMVIP